MIGKEALELIKKALGITKAKICERCGKPWVRRNETYSGNVAHYYGPSCGCSHGE
jgi:hypothetical protein